MHLLGPIISLVQLKLVYLIQMSKRHVSCGISLFISLLGYSTHIFLSSLFLPFLSSHLKSPTDSPLPMNSLIYAIKRDTLPALFP